MNKRTGRWIWGWMDGWMLAEVDGWMDGWMLAEVDGLVERLMGDYGGKGKALITWKWRAGTVLERDTPWRSTASKRTKRMFSLDICCLMFSMSELLLQPEPPAQGSLLSATTTQHWPID